MPAEEADRRTLARRLSYDLTGLPPEPSVVEAFVLDPHADAYERLVDAFLTKLEWGEHRGRHWLDYADMLTPTAFTLTTIVKCGPIDSG